MAALFVPTRAIQAGPVSVSPGCRGQSKSDPHTVYLTIPLCGAQLISDDEPPGMEGFMRQS